MREPEQRHGPRSRSSVVGRISIVQEDRIRIMDDAGRGFLFTVAPRVAPTARLERWRDAGALLRVDYRGMPDAGAVAISMAPLA